MKACTRCKQEKPFSDFYRQGHRYRSACKVCYAEHNREQNEKHADKRAAYDASRGPGWARNGSRERYEPTEAEKADSHLRRTYGITAAEYEAILEKQGGVCAICSQECNRSTSERFCVDHDHETGLVRGLLCFKCNVGLGRFDDDIGRLNVAIAYLRAAEGRKHHKSVFISGPMSGLPASNYPAFNRVAKRLRSLGYRVENPAENKCPSGAWEDYMRASIAQLVTCDCIAYLPNWEQSRGARLEAKVATELELEVLDLAAVEVVTPSMGALAA